MKALVYDINTGEASEKEVSPSEVLVSQDYAAEIAREIKQHTSERIKQVTKDEATERNLTAFAVKLARMEAKGTISDVDKAFLDALDALQTWVMATLATGRKLVAAQDPTFRDDKHWPPKPEGVEALVRAL